MNQQARSKKEQMQQLDNQLENLEQSPLFAYRQKNDYQTVLGEGSLEAEVIFVGEAPGKTEAETGRPFVGASGRLLDGFLEQIGLQRLNVYITSILKDRPPHNRDPKADEIEVYAPLMIRQFEIIEPRVIVPLGRFATKFIFNHFGLEDQLEKISQLHGKVFETEASFAKIAIFPMYHPAFALYNASKRPVLAADFEKLKLLLEEKHGSKAKS